MPPLLDGALEVLCWQRFFLPPRCEKNPTPLPYLQSNPRNPATYRNLLLELRFKLLRSHSRYNLHQTTIPTCYQPPHSWINPEPRSPSTYSLLPAHLLVTLTLTHQEHMQSSLQQSHDYIEPPPPTLLYVIFQLYNLHTSVQ